jgi:D-alanyl-D-alanine dipeptidase
MDTTTIKRAASLTLSHANLCHLLIPEEKSQKTALDYHDIPIDLDGKLNQEPLVNVSVCGIASDSFYSRVRPPYDRAFGSAISKVLVRESVAAALAEVNRCLKPYGVELLVWDGWRSIELQAELWEHFIEKGRSELVQPTEDDLVRFAGIYCSNPSKFDPRDYKTWPVHNTGGAVDLTLRSLENGQELFMGSGFDHAGPESATRYCEQDAHSSVEAKHSRRLLYHAMASKGFVNYPHEWWHYDLYTQLGVMNGDNQPPALYGRTSPA